MAADLFILIKNDFDDIKDLEKARWYGYKVIGNLERQLGKDAIEEFVCSTDEEGLAFVSFDLGPYDMNLTLRNGFWICYNGIHHKHLIDDYKGIFMLCETAQKVAMLFGEKEAWYTYDMAMDKYETEISLDDLISDMKSRGCYGEFNRSELLGMPRSKRSIYTLCHDSFDL